MNGVKKWYKSKTIIFALLFGAVSVAGIFGYADYSPSGDTVEIVNIVVSIVVVVLRYITNTAIE